MKTGHSQVTDTAFQFPDGKVRRLHGNRAESDEASGMGRDDLGNVIAKLRAKRAKSVASGMLAPSEPEPASEAEPALVRCAAILHTLGSQTLHHIRLVLPVTQSSLGLTQRALLCCRRRAGAARR